MEGGPITGGRSHYIGATTESRSAAGRHHRTFHDGLEFLECEGIHVGIQEVPGDEAHLSSERDLKFVRST